MAKSKHNLYGQEMGAKGVQTRTKILKATNGLIEKRAIRELKVSEICALAGVSSSTFYLYFQTVPEAALAVAQEANQSSPEIMEIFESQWTRDNAYDQSREFVKAYFAYWAENSAILRIRNFAADEGDRRFFEVRRRAIEPIHFAIQKKITEFQALDRSAPRLHAPSAASVLIALMERTAVVVLLPSAHKATRPRQVEVVAFLIASTLLGYGPPPN